MSADSHTVCPRCNPEVLKYTGKPNAAYPLVTKDGLLDWAAEEQGYDRDVRENIDYGLCNSDGKLVLYFEYRADCWTCGWHFEAKLEEPVPGLTPSDVNMIWPGMPLSVSEKSPQEEL